MHTTTHSTENRGSLSSDMRVATGLDSLAHSHYSGDTPTC